MLKGEGSFNDWSNERPGNRYLIKASDLPKPYATDSAPNQSKVVPRPADAWPKVPDGFKIDQALTGLESPRTIITAPNGDLFVAESNPGRIRVLRGFGADGKVVTNEVFATGLTMPYGIAFYPPGPNPQYVYIGNTNSIVRFPYKNGDLKASGPSEVVVASIPGGAQYGGGHWTRSLVFSKTAKSSSKTPGCASSARRHTQAAGRVCSGRQSEPARWPSGRHFCRGSEQWNSYFRCRQTVDSDPGDRTQFRTA